MMMRSAPSILPSSTAQESETHPVFWMLNCSKILSIWVRSTSSYEMLFFIERYFDVSTVCRI